LQTWPDVQTEKKHFARFAPLREKNAREAAKSAKNRTADILQSAGAIEEILCALCASARKECSRSRQERKEQDSKHLAIDQNNRRKPLRALRLCERKR
jgi:hypothetical protein